MGSDATGKQRIYVSRRSSVGLVV
ncbi:BgTH12-05080 [Blumeria graminis f. sp. triticale]|uniref:BgTH12-05080 n=1 Tax=Blumeria graminis f. sp. triticale TaxID=1689686 RepID=A0A9W4D1A3_BLUGR|nr:BgTH12-05080 [Blumeria graminis f. sp. triticale]